MALESLAHEIKNDICTISLRTDELSGIAHRAAPELSAADLEAVRELSGGLSGVALTANEKTRLLTGSAAEKGNVNVRNCLRIAASRCRAIAARTLENANRIRIDLPPRDTGEQWEVWAAPAALTIVFFNLYLNAAQQIDMLVRTGIRGGGRVWHTCERCVDELGKEQAIVRIHDTGPGIHREDWDLIFKPGYTTKDGGTGLGLHICRYLVKEIGSKGRRADVMVARSTIWGGTTFTVKLPLETISEGH
jgi:signal transduction histidine kinase